MSLAKREHDENVLDRNIVMEDNDNKSILD